MVPCYIINTFGNITRSFERNTIKITLVDSIIDVSPEFAEKCLKSNTINCTLSDFNVITGVNYTKSVPFSLTKFVCTNFKVPLIKHFMWIIQYYRDVPTRFLLDTLALIYGDIFMANREYTGYLQDKFQNVLDASPCRYTHSSFKIHGKKENIKYSGDPLFYGSLRESWPNILAEFPRIYKEILNIIIPDDLFCEAIEVIQEFCAVPLKNCIKDHLKKCPGYFDIIVHCKKY